MPQFGSNLVKIFLLATIAAMVAAPSASAQTSTLQTPAASEPRPVFDVATIKPSAPSMTYALYEAAAPGDLRLSGFTVRELILNAYGLLPFQLTGEPAWADSQRYDITAKVIDDSTDENVNRFVREHGTSRATAAITVSKLRLQSLLADRFQLEVHMTTKEMPIYALVIAKNGPKFHSHSESPFRIGPGLIEGHGVSMDVLIANLSFELDHILIDKTGLTGTYDIALKWTPDDASASNWSAPSLRTALEEQLGLKIESQKGPVKVLVVDRVARPSSN
jgi:bla regulator protein BlaR1